MIHQDNAPTDIAPRRVITQRDQRPHTAIGAQYPCPGHDRAEFFTFGQQRLYFLRGNPDILDIAVGDFFRGGTDQGDGIAGHQDIGIGWLATAVDYHAVDTIIHDQQGTLGREHANGQVSVFTDLLTPDTGSVYHLLGMNSNFFTGPDIDAVNPAHPTLGNNQANHLCIT